MAEKEDLQNKFQEFQLLQQRLALFATQKQQLQLQLAELEHALAELNSAKPPVYELVGEILVEKSPENLKKSLQERKDDIELRISAIEKQENKTKEKVQELQKELSEKLKLEKA
jgi:prefoldin beta subunit